MNLKMRKLLEINEGILRFMGRTAVGETAVSCFPKLPERRPPIRREPGLACQSTPAAAGADLSCLPLLTSPDKSQTTLNHWVAKARSAGFQPAVAQIFNLRIAPTANGLPNEIRRYGRLKTCATSLRIRIAPESL
jgi:hypothetical protein